MRLVKERISSISFVVYFSFGAALLEKMAEKFKRMHNVLDVEPHQFVTLRYETYIGIPVKNEKHNLMTRQFIEQEMGKG